MIIGPGQCVRGIRRIVHPLAAGLRQAESEIGVPAVFEKNIGEIVRGDGVVGLNVQCLLISGLCLLPITFVFVQRAEQNEQLSIVGSHARWRACSWQWLHRFSLRGLNGGKSGDRSEIRRVEFSGTGKGFFRFSSLVIAQLRLAEHVDKARIVRRFLDLFLEAGDGGTGLAAQEIELRKSLLSLQRSRITRERLLKQIRWRRPNAFAACAAGRVECNRWDFAGKQRSRGLGRFQRLRRLPGWRERKRAGCSLRCC